MKLALDHHYPTAIAEQLRCSGHDAVAAVERHWHREPDEALLALCATEQRTLVTNNVGDFMTIIRAWAVQGRSHAGLIFTSDASLPRTRATIGTYVKLLDAFLDDHPTSDGFVDRVHWL
jgi:predicted oxidoreductase